MVVFRGVHFTDGEIKIEIIFRVDFWVNLIRLMRISTFDFRNGKLESFDGGYDK